MVLYIFVVAVLNLGAGFAVAVLLARRSPKPKAPAAGRAAADAASGSTAFETPAGDGADEAEPSRCAPPPVARSEAEPASGEPRQRSASEAAVERFNGKVEQYHERLVDVDDQLRGWADGEDIASVKACLDSLRSVNEQYLVANEEAQRDFEQLFKEQQEFQAVCESLHKAAEAQTTQIRQTNDSIEGFDYEADVEKGCREMIDHTARLLGANHQVRDALDEAMVNVARSEQRPAALAEPGRHDPLTGLASRAEFETQLDTWWERDPHRTKPLCVAMIDLDEFAKVNQRHGQRTGDRVLRAIGQLLAAECRQHAAAARFAGQRFLLLFEDTDARFATNIVERIRQLVDVSRLRNGEEEIRVTVSCAVTEAAADDSRQSLLSRAEATLREAKRYGRNRTFLFEGEYPAPVVPPNFSLEEKSITI